MHNWLVGATYPSEKYEFVNWDDYSQCMEKYKMFQTTNQSLYILIQVIQILTLRRRQDVAQTLGQMQSIQAKSIKDFTNVENWKLK